MKNNRPKWASLFLVIFPYAIALGAYSQTNAITLSFYLIIAVFLFAASPNKTLEFIRGNQLLGIWLVYILVGFSSTIFFGQFDGLHTIITEILFTFICYVLCANAMPEEYFNLFRWTGIFFAVLGLLTFLFNIDFFAFKNALGLPYTSVDPRSGGGISTIFEYRHYYGLFLVAVLFVQIIYPFNKAYYNIAVLLLIGANIVATYTISLWLVLSICIFFWFLKQCKGRILKRTILNVFIIMSILFLCGIFFSMYYSDKIAAILVNLDSRIKEVFDTSDAFWGGVRFYSLREGSRYIFTNWEKYLLFGGGSGYAMQWMKANPFGQWGQWSSSIDVQYITSFMDSGIMGIIMVAIMVKRIFSSVFKSQEKINNLIAFILLYFVFIMFFYDVFGTVTSVFAMWCICICMLKRNHINSIEVKGIG